VPITYEIGHALERDEIATDRARFLEAALNL
jgi:hypothetical protein